MLCEKLVPPDEFIWCKPWLCHLLFRWDRFGIYPNAPQHLIHRVPLVRMGVSVCDRLKKCQVVKVTDEIPETGDRRDGFHTVNRKPDPIVTRKAEDVDRRATVCQYLGDRQRHERVTETSRAVQQTHRVPSFECPNIKVADSRFGITHATELPVDLWIFFKTPDLRVQKCPCLPGFVNTPYTTRRFLDQQFNGI
jgi:hypothetical protein